MESKKINHLLSLSQWKEDRNKKAQLYWAFFICASEKSTKHQSKILDYHGVKLYANNRQTLKGMKEFHLSKHHDPFKRQFVRLVYF